MNSFSAMIEIIDINPYVEVPQGILHSLQIHAQKEKGPIPVKGTLQGKSYIQTVVKFRGLWRLYLNAPMLKTALVEVGDEVTIEIEYDSEPRTVIPPKQFTDLLLQNKKAKETFYSLPPYKQKEFARYLNNLKSEEAVNRNIEKIMKFLHGEKVKGVLF